MHPLERQVQALELILALRLAMDPPRLVGRLAQAVRAGLEDAGPDERRIREHALSILEDQV